MRHESDINGNSNKKQTFMKFCSRLYKQQNKNSQNNSFENAEK